MSKLYRATESRAPETVKSEEHDALDDLDFPELGQGLEMSLEASQMALERLECLGAMRDTLAGRKLCSDAYITSMEGCSAIVGVIGARLGVRHLPALEDFANPYAAQESHNFAMEGFKDMIAKAWQKIKDFFRSFFKTITLFLKRIAKANLDLESYEKYCDHLVAKLVANKATLSDNTPLFSALPEMLAGRGDESIDSDFVLNQGQHKIKSLIAVVQNLTMQGASGAALAEGVRAYQADLSGFIALNKVSAMPGETLREATALLRQKGFGLISKMFSYTLNSPSDLPAPVYQSLRSHYDGADLASDGFTVLSVAEPYDPYRQLPRGVNMYLTHVNHSKLFIATGKEEPGTVDGKLKPIGSLSNLSTFHKEYKNTLARIDVKGLDKGAQSLSSEVDKVLTLLQKDFSELLDDSKVMSKSYSVEFVCEMFKRLKASSVNAAEAATNAASTVQFEGNENKMVSLLGDIGQAYDEGREATPGAIQLVSDLKDLVRGSEADFKAFVNAFYDAHQSSMPDDGSRALAMREFNAFLTNLFSRIQSLYKCLMTDFYAALTELRYAVIKYIYDSAKRYSY